MRVIHGLTLAVVFCGAWVGHAQEAPKADQPARPAFALVLKATPSADQNGQIEIAWTNTSNHELVWQRAPVDLIFDIDIQDATLKRPLRRVPGKAMESKEKIVELRTGGGPLLVLMPGETVKCKVDLTKIFDLTKKGSYLVRLHRFDGDTKVNVVSNEITISLQ